MYIIKTKKFILRFPQISDAKDIAEHLKDKDISKWMSSVPYPYSINDAKSWIKKKIKSENNKNPTSISFVIVIGNEVVGTISLNNLKQNHKAEVGYWLAKKCHGKGLMTEILQTVVSFAFKKLKLKRIQAIIYEQNIGSKKVCERNGFKVEGFMKNYAKKDNKLVNAFLYSIILKDFD